MLPSVARRLHRQSRGASTVSRAAPPASGGAAGCRSIVLSTFYFAWRYRRLTPNQAPLPSPSHHTLLELVWSGIPLLLAVYIFYVGFEGYLNLQTPPANAYSIDVTAQKWSWSFAYPNGFVPTDGKLHVPAGEPVKLVMGSRDVLHCVYIRDFRMKQDVVPGRYTTLWFTADAPDGDAETQEHHLTCAEYCGTGHSDMSTEVVVHKDRATFERWLSDASKFDVTLGNGQMLYEKNCKVCHLLDTKLVGPPWNDLARRLKAGEARPLADGTTVKVDEEYLRRSIYDPNAQIAEGFQPAMPTFKGQLKDEHIRAIILYIRSLAQ